MILQHLKDPHTHFLKNRLHNPDEKEKHPPFPANRPPKPKTHFPNHKAEQTHIPISLNTLKNDKTSKPQANTLNKQKRENVVPSPQPENSKTRAHFPNH